VKKPQKFKKIIVLFVLEYKRGSFPLREVVELGGFFFLFFCFFPSPSLSNYKNATNKVLKNCLSSRNFTEVSSVKTQDYIPGPAQYLFLSYGNSTTKTQLIDRKSIPSAHPISKRFTI
jgi:hypothetical protein